ncbi:MAG: helix-turn-helix transcriptional regulator, partial [Erysipelotrichaceae bacterium]
VPVCYHNIFFEIHPIHLAPQFIETLHQLATDYIIFEDVEGLNLPLFLQIEQELKNKKQGYSFVMDTLLQMIVLQVIRHTPALGLEAKLKTKPQQNEASNILYQATQYIQTNLYSNLRIKEISLHVGVSDNYLFKLFKQYLHCSPSSYIINCKIKHACTMLESKQYTIQEIANHLGYSSAYHFSNVFKKEMGISPSKYVSQ